MTRLADFTASHPRRVAVAVAIAFVAFLAYGGKASSVLNARNGFADPGSQSAHARTQIERATGAEASPGVLALVREAPGGPSVAFVERTLRADPDVARVAPAAPSRDARSVVVAASLRASADQRASVERLEGDFAGRRAVVLGGQAVAQRQVSQQASADLGLAEALAFPLLALLAFLFFRGVAALLPLAVGAVSVFAAFAALRLVDSALSLSVFALNLVIGLGLGLAVDYSLFLVSRFREELGAGREVPDAVRATMATAGRTVLYSAVTVAIALSSLTVFPLRFLQSMGVGGAVVALLAAAVALTLLPALFVLAGGRLGRVRPGPANAGRWYRLAHAVLRRPGAVAALAVAALVLLSLPALRTRWSGVDASVLPRSRSARVVEDALARGFPQLRAAPAFVAVRAPVAAAASVGSYAARLRAVPGVASVAAPSYVGAGTWALHASLRGEAIAPTAQRAIETMRAVPSAWPASVGGAGAEFTDQRAALGRDLPAALAILVLGTLLVLWLMTGSAILPVKALLMNALTVGAATGLLVLVFQDGRLKGLLSYSPQGGIEQSDYLVLAALAFALSTDYGVFLLTRIKEARDRGASDREAIAVGLQRTGRIVSAAAILLAVAIGAFATSKVVFLKEIGVGAVAAVLLDAFVVRTLLVPALMALLGRWNWWSPAFLRGLHERVAVRAEEATGGGAVDPEGEDAGAPPRRTHYAA